jgi:hypothetical protein
MVKLSSATTFLRPIADKSYNFPRFDL